MDSRHDQKHTGFIVEKSAEIFGPRRTICARIAETDSPRRDNTITRRSDVNIAKAFVTLGGLALAGLTLIGPVAAHTNASPAAGARAAQSGGAPTTVSRSLK